jgi:hypothetical protein
VNVIINRGATSVHLHMAQFYWNEPLLFARQSVIKLNATGLHTLILYGKDDEAYLSIKPRA